ncbi:kinesin-like protein KIF20B [Sinocyclocheilus grahami]|uniref:kinesin-like protein KIF20B n=1 Tax=Sinocyclocheilus grahami TaxID=75366 RepID=UPI0007AD0961|nr:PREDICTED: kinesin-like protein KIF20B [Sinocyclocheilus grahami]
MMESCLNHKPERVTVEDIKKDLSSDFSKLSKDSVLLGKEHLHVYLRVRPFTTSERAEGASQECISIEPPETVILKAHRPSLTARHSERFGPQQAQRFQFSQVYGPDTTQREIFDGTTKSLVKEVLDGGNSLIFTYGVTNAGKTFTFLGPDSDCGILPRSLNVIFKSIEGRIYSQNSIKPHRCVDFMKLTEEQQDDEATDKRNLFRRFKDIDPRKTLSSMSSSSCSLFESSTFSDTNRDSVCLDDTSNVKFSVWVSFCEIYNENIHDLLDVAPNVSHRRTVLRLAQDVKGNAFVKDQKWVQVNSAEEALKVVKIGMKNQSSSSTKLNNVSSRSHSIFSIRILRIEDVGVPHVQTISELSLCDLAGSERCARTQNQGDRLKEAGNINTSLLTLGKCINALRLNQTQPKIHQHIPFRESKLTHYLQGFFCGRGKACMIININQCASVYDETLNVLKFSALAQKVVVLNPKPAPSIAVKRSDRNVSMIINNADKKDWTRRSSLMGWEMNQEDMQEDKDDEEMGEEDDEECDDKSMEDNIVLETVESRELFELQVKIEEFKEKLSKDESEKLTMESRIHEEVRKFMELFSNMEKDYNDRLQRAKEIVEERRLEILKNLVNRTIGEMAAVSTDENAAKEAKIEHLDSMIEAMRDDLAKIKGDAEAVQICLTNVPESPRTISDLRTQLEEMREELLKSQQLLSLKTIEFEAMCVQMQESDYQLLQANRNYENKKLRCQELMSVCQEKNGMISTLQTALDQNVEAATKDQALINNIKEEILNFRNNCKCMLNEDGEPRGEEMTSQKTQQLLQELKMKDEQLNELKLERCSLEKKVCDLSDRLAEQTRAYEATVAMERAEVNKVTNENKALANELHVLQQTASEMRSKLKTLQMELSTQTKIANELSEELDAAKALIKGHQAEYCSQSKSIESLMTEADHLRQELSTHQLSHDKTQAECERMVELSHEKSRQINDLEQEVSQTSANMCQLKELCSQLQYERDAQAKEYQSLLSCYEAQKVVVAQIKSNSELLEELNVLNHQQGRIEEQEQDSRDDCWKKLQDKLIQTLSKLNQHEEVQNIVRTIVENEISEVRDKAKRRITAMEKDLAHKDAELETKAQEFSNHLRQELSARQLSHDKTQAECERMVELSHEKSRQINDLEQEVSQTRANMCQLKELCSQLQYERDAQAKEYQSLLSCYEAQKVVVAQIKSNSELLEELNVLNHQQGRIEEQEQDSRDDCWKKLQDKLIQTLRKLNQHEEVQNIVRTIVENEISEVRDKAKRRITAMEKDLAHKDAELETKAQEFSNHLRQELSARQLSHDKTQAECERMVELSHEKSRQINDLEQEVSQTRANMCQLKELCSQLQYERDAQAKEYQSLLSCYEAQKVVVAQIKSNSELLEELNVLNHQQGRIEEQEQDSRDDCWKKLQEKLIQTLRKLNQHEEVQNIVRTIVENEISEVRDKAKRRITAMEKDLAHKDAELETKAHELSKLRKLVNDGRNKIKTLSYDLQQVERERSDVRDQLCEANMQKEQLEKQIFILSEENKMFQQRLCEANKLRDQAGHSLSCTEQSIDPQQTVKPNHVIEEENIQPFQTTCQDLLAEQKLIKEMCGNLNNKCTQTDEEKLLEAKLNETESIAEGVCSNYPAQLQEMYQKPSFGVSVEPQQEEQRACRPAENTKDILKQQRAEKQDTIVKLQREKDDLSVSCKAVTQKVDHPKQTSKVKTENEGNYFTPLKPERMNVRKPGEEESVTKKLRSTARKRKSPELESSVESENRKNRRLKVNNRKNMQSIETPTVQGKKVSQLKQKGSASLKGKKDGALKKIGDFIQSSPTLFGSKAKKIISMVNVKSPEPLNPSENNKPKRSKRKLFKTHVSSPLDITYHHIIGSSDDNQESDHLIIKRKLRTRTAKI